MAARAATAILWLRSLSCIDPIIIGGSGITVEDDGRGVPLEKNSERAGPEGEGSWPRPGGSRLPPPSRAHELSSPGTSSRACGVTWFHQSKVLRPKQTSRKGIIGKPFRHFSILLTNSVNRSKGTHHPGPKGHGLTFAASCSVRTASPRALRWAATSTRSVNSSSSTSSLWSNRRRWH